MTANHTGHGNGAAKRRVLITGAGIISALGAGVSATLRALKEGRSGVAPVSYLDTEHRELPVGEVKATNAELAETLGVGYPASELRTVLLGICAAREAVASAALTPADIRRAAFINGTTVGGMDKTESHFAEVFNSNAATPDSEELRYNGCGSAGDIIADATGHFGMVTTSSTACSSAANAIIMGANLIKSGLAEIVVAGGAESLTRFHLNGFNSLMILDKERCRPFDRDRAGINLGEGAAYVVLESASSAARRGSKPLAELTGYANACDAYHQTATSDEGEGAYLAMRKAMDMASLTPGDIDYINAHGTGTPNNDASELAAMERIWGPALPRFSSTKSLTGHTTSASGSIEAVICMLAMRDDAQLRHVVSNSFGFGGNDSTLIFSRTESEQ